MTISLPDLENGQPHTDRFRNIRMFQASLQESDQPHADFSPVTGHFPTFREEKKEKNWKAHPGHLSKTDILSIYA